MTTTTRDWADEAVDFGPFTYAAIFNPRALYYRPLPATPPPAASYGREDCRCPHCTSEGFYAASPCCRFWRHNCDLCSGRRTVFDYSTKESVSCDQCEDAWREDVRFFKDALRSPAATARKLRSDAAASR